MVPGYGWILVRYVFLLLTRRFGWWTAYESNMFVRKQQMRLTLAVAVGYRQLNTEAKQSMDVSQSSFPRKKNLSVPADKTVVASESQ